MAFGAAAVLAPWFLFVFLAYALLNAVTLPFAIRTLFGGIVLKAPTWHRCWSSMFALTGFAFLTGSSLLTLVAGMLGMLLFALCTIDLMLLNVAAWPAAPVRRRDTPPLRLVSTA